jgi:hypothetical protein
VLNAPVPERDAAEDRRAAVTAFLQNLDLAKALARIAGALTAPPSQADAEHAAAHDATPAAAPVAEAMFAELGRIARERGAEPLLVYLPTRVEAEPRPQPVRDWAARAAHAGGLRFLDATPALRGRDPAPLFGLANHYSEAGNALVAEALLSPLRRLCHVGG